MKKMHVSATIWRTLAILVVLVLITAYLTSYLAARFTSASGDDDSARVAKWGYELDLDASALLGAQYADTDTDDATPAVKTNDLTGTLSVKGASNIVTPNSSGSATITIKVKDGASPEVAAKFWVYSDCTVPSIKENGTTYIPIKWTLTRTGTLGNDTVVDNGTIEQVIAALNNVGTLSPTVNATYTLTWEWPLESGMDAADTALMLAAAGSEIDTTVYTDVTTDFKIDISFHIEQIN